MHTWSHLTLCNPMVWSLPGSSVHGFIQERILEWKKKKKKTEYWSGLLVPSPGDRPDPGIKLVSPMSPPWAGGFLTSWAIRGSPWCFNRDFLFFLFLFHLIIICRVNSSLFPHLFTYLDIYIHMDLWTLSFFVV